MTVLSAIDIGSNAFRLSIASLDLEMNLQLLESARESVRLGHDVFSRGIISSETISRSVEALGRFGVLAKKYNVQTTRAVGTSALREAQNSDEFVREVQKHTGISISTISGEEEARLVFLAVRSKFDLSNKVALLVDLGGGSLEISVIDEGELVVSDSVKMGTVRLIQLLEEKDRGREVFNRLVEEYSGGVKRLITKELGKRKLDLCIGTGGNFEALAELRVQLLGKNRKTLLRDSELDKLVSQLRSLSFEERIGKLGLKPDRADVIMPAALVVRKIMEHSGVKEIQIPAVGLRDGVLLDLCSEKKGLKPEGVRKQVLAYARELGRRFGLEDLHAKSVSELALKLFDQTDHLHKLDAEQRLLLEVAAWVQNVGQCISNDDHHKHSYYILSSTPFVGLGPRQKKLVAALARYHRGAEPNEDHPEFNTLLTEDKARLRKLSCLLRMANALDSEHDGNVRKVEISSNQSKAFVTIDGRGDLLLERWALSRERQFFKKSFGLELEIRD